MTTSIGPDARLDLLDDFVNTREVERARDAIGTPAQLAAWLTEHGHPAGEPDPATHARALVIREGIRALGRANNDEPLDAEAVAALNAAARVTPLVVAIGGDGPGDWHLAPGAGGVDGFLGRVLAALTATMADGSFSRMKSCRNDRCRWLFHDRSRNRSGTWCSMATCGSRAKARAYRARRQASTGA